jgi:hypothetical protein
MRLTSASMAALALTVTVLHAGTAAAQHTLNLSVGAFALRGEDARAEGDVLIKNRELFLFDFSDFRSPSLTAEWLVPIGDYVEAGAGIGFARRTVPTIYDDFVRPDGTEIDQEIRLRTVPMAATVRILPFGRNRAFQPYVGGGIGVTNWRYSETGDFIDFTVAGRPIFHDSFTATGTAVGPVAVFGARVPMGRTSLGGEIRYQKAEGDLDERDFLGPTLDLGGFHYVATFGIRFCSRA